MFAAATEVVGDDLGAVRKADHMAGGAEIISAPQRLEHSARIKRPGRHHAVRRVVPHHDAVHLIDQRRIGDTPAGQSGYRNRLNIPAVAEIHSDQPVRGVAHTPSDHGPQVPVLAVVHEPRVAHTQHHIPAVGLFGAGRVVEAPVLIEHECRRHRVPVESEDAPHSHHVERVAHCTKPRDRRLRALDLRAGEPQRIRCQHRQPGIAPIRNVLGHDQPVIQHHETVVRLVNWQPHRFLHTAVAPQPVCPAPVHHVQIAIGMQCHAAGPHRPAGQPG